MAKSLIIVESPAKTKTLKNFLGADYKIEASMGHVRDLPKSKLGVDVENDFAPTYQAITDRKDVLKKLADAAKGVTTVYLASDPDREGEAIAWHIQEALKLTGGQVKRIQFNEITKQAVQQALANPRTVNMDRVNAQQARRVLDRLIGYKLSPVLAKKIQRGATAGRVQSVAVRLVCEREREIRAFVPQEYWSLTAMLTPVPPEKRFAFPARLTGRGGQKLEPKTQGEIEAILADLGERLVTEPDPENADNVLLRAVPGAQGRATFTVADVKRREQKRNPSAPFITSTLQQEAARKLGFGARRTMSTAQSLYEGVELGGQGSVGLITYMRTDSVRIAAEAQTEARAFISERYGADYVPATARQYKTKGEAQDAHEAIRPTSTRREPEAVAQYLTSDQLRLYRLIWQRFVASQMSPAIMDVTTADIDATSPANTGAPYTFRASGTIIKFDGFMRVYMEGKDTEEKTDEEQPPLPPLARSQPLDELKMEPRQHFTEPPPRYSEATLVKALEEQGIGRPSTYANIISTIQDRDYVNLQDKRFYPTELGFKVTDQLVKHFPNVMDVKFTADMETRLDEVEEGRTDWVSLLRTFYDPFATAVETAKVEMENLKPAPVETDYYCPATGKAMLLRTGRFGAFMGCSGYPECKKILKLDDAGSPVEGPNFTCGLAAEGGAMAVDPASLPNATEYGCPLGRERGVMLERKGRFGTFLGCSNYPKCRTTLKTDAAGALQPNQTFECTYSDAPTKGKRGATAKAKPEDEAAPKRTTRTAKTAATKASSTKTTGAKTTALKTTTKAAARTTATKAAAKDAAGADGAVKTTRTRKPKPEEATSE